MDNNQSRVQLVTEVIRLLCIPAGMKGFQHLKMAILIVLESPYNIQSLSRYVYPDVAKRFGDTISMVERSIRYAISVGWSRADDEAKLQFLGQKTKQPTNKQFIYGICDYVFTIEPTSSLSKPSELEM
jgi:two-component system response regulator (stage 0 sporulation protein A)